MLIKDIVALAEEFARGIKRNILPLYVGDDVVAELHNWNRFEKRAAIRVKYKDTLLLVVHFSTLADTFMGSKDDDPVFHILVGDADPKLIEQGNPRNLPATKIDDETHDILYWDMVALGDLMTTHCNTRIGAIIRAEEERADD